MPTQTFSSQRQEDQTLELCLRCDEDVRELFSDRALELCAAITEKRLHGWADWFTRDDLETLIALYRRSESVIVRSEITHTMQFVVSHSQDNELVCVAKEFLKETEIVPITTLVRKRLLER